jgi:hypothetical protein
MEHARIGPSSLARVIRCPGSVRESQGVPRTSSIFAAEGTVLHEIAAACLDFDMEPDDWVGATMSADGFDFEITSELVACMYRALDWLREQDGEFYVEKRVKLDKWMPDQFGTCDVGIWQPKTETVVIFDWKFGMGVPVQAFENEQGCAYALGFVDTYLTPLGIRPKHVRIIIEQPRCAGGGNYSEPWDISYDRLLEFGGMMRWAFKQANDPQAPLTPGPKQCTFCDARLRRPAPGDVTGCGAYDRHLAQMFGADFDDLDAGSEIAPPENVTALRRSLIVRNAKTVEKWLAQLHDDSITAAEHGQPDPGMKMVAGRKGHRKWKDAKKAEVLLKQALHDEAFTFKLKSPTGAEKDMLPRKGKEGHPKTWVKLEKLIDQDQGRPVLVFQDDDRPALPSLSDQFDDL